MIAFAFGRAITQLTDPRIFKIILVSLALTLSLLFGLVSVIFYAISASGIFASLSLPFIGELDWTSFGWAAKGFLGAMLIVILMVPITQTIQSFLLDRVADAVEAKHYPNLPPDRRISMATLAGEALRGLGVLVIANLLSLILYLLFAPFALLIFIGVNGWVLGREYFLVAGIRRADRSEIKELRGRYSATLLFSGCLLAAGLLIPFVNLIIPVLGAAVFTHLFHQMR